ncbi:MAG TPA: hypothetical protein VGM82_23955 [Gemmatimonadaceae bacterium]|jgi:hypothetical protein
MSHHASHDESKNHPAHGRGAEKEIAHEIETATGHPPREASDAQSGQMPVDMPPSTEAHEQHSRKGQAESPRELNPNQPEKKHG